MKARSSSSTALWFYLNHGILYGNVSRVVVEVKTFSRNRTLLVCNEDERSYISYSVYVTGSEPLNVNGRSVGFLAKSTTAYPSQGDTRWIAGIAVASS